MAGSLMSTSGVRAFINEYFAAWHQTNEDRILSYYAENVSFEIPGTVMKGRAAVRDQFVRPFVAGFPGNHHVVKNMVFGENVVFVEWSFEANHSGPFGGTLQPGLG